MNRPEKLFLRYRTRGDARALGRAFDATAPEILRVARYLVRTDGDIEDVLQETWLSAIESAARWDESKPLLPWLLGIAANHVRTLRRRRRGADPTAGEREGDCRDGALAAAASREPGPAERAQASELEAELEAALARIRPPYSEVLGLHLREDLAPGEIAGRLERSPDTVRSQLRRGLDLLRRALPAGAAAVAVAGPATASPARVAAIRGVVVGEATRRGATVGFALPWQAVAAVLLVAAGALYWAWPDAATATDVARGPITSAASEPVAPSPPAESARSVDRTPVAAAGAAAAAADGPTIKVVDAARRPVEGVDLVAVDVPLQQAGLPTQRELDEALAEARRRQDLEAPLSGRSSRTELLAAFAAERAASTVRGRSDADGLWRMDAGEPATIRIVSARAADGRTGLLPLLPPELDGDTEVLDSRLPVVEPDSTDTFELRLTAPRSLRVLVVDRADTPVPGIPVLVEAPPTCQLFGPWYEVTGHDGVATFPALQDLEPFTPPGDEIAVVPGYPHVREAEPARFDPRRPPAEPIVLRLPERPTGSLRIRLVEGADAPLLGFALLQVTAWAEDPLAAPSDELERMLLAPVDGTARLPRVEVGTHFQAQAWLEDGRSAEVRGPGPHAAGEEVELVLRLGGETRLRLTGIVQGPGGAPLAGRVAHLRITGRVGDDVVDETLAPVELDGAGRFDVTSSEMEEAPAAAVVACTVEPLAAAPAGAASVRLGPLPLGAHDLGTLCCAATLPVAAGRVVTSGGQPLFDAEVEAWIGASGEAIAESGFDLEAIAEPDPVAVPPALAEPGARPAVVPLAQRSPLAAAGRVITTTGAGAEPLLPAPGAVVVPRGDGYFDVYSTAPAADRVTITARSRRANAEAIVSCSPGSLSVAVVVDPRAELRGTLGLRPRWDASWFEVEVRNADGRRIGRTGTGHGLERGSFVLTGLPAGLAALSVVLRGETEPLTRIEGLELRPGEVCRDPRLARIALPDTVRVIALDVRAPDGKPWRSVADEGIVWFGASGTVREDRLEQTFDLDETGDTVLPTRRRAIDVEIEVPGFRMVRLRDVDADRRVVLEPGIPVRVVSSLEGGGGNVLVMRLRGDDWEPNQPVLSVPLEAGGHADFRVALPGRYQLLGVDGSPQVIEVLDRAELQVFRFE